MIFNIDEYLNIIGELPLNMRFGLSWQTYTKCSYKHMLVIQYFPTNSEFSHNSKIKHPSLHAKRCLHNIMTIVYEVADLYFVHTTFDIYVLLLSLGQYFCWWTLSPRRISPTHQSVFQHWHGLLDIFIIFILTTEPTGLF
jgi:hypothetical protein